MLFLIDGMNGEREFDFSGALESKATSDFFPELTRHYIRCNRVEPVSRTENAVFLSK